MVERRAEEYNLVGGALEDGIFMLVVQRLCVKDLLYFGTFCPSTPCKSYEGYQHVRQRMFVLVRNRSLTFPILSEMNTGLFYLRVQRIPSLIVALHDHL